MKKNTPSQHQPTRVVFNPKVPAQRPIAFYQPKKIVAYTPGIGLNLGMSRHPK